MIDFAVNEFGKEQALEYLERKRNQKTDKEERKAIGAFALFCLAGLSLYAWVIF